MNSHRRECEQGALPDRPQSNSNGSKRSASGARPRVIRKSRGAGLSAAARANCTPSDEGKSQKNMIEMGDVFAAVAITIDPA